MAMPRTTERRQHPRFNLAPMYSAVTAQRQDNPARTVSGHAYNISEGGIRLEIEGKFQVGEHVHLDITLPGEMIDIHACGKIVWSARGDDDPAARRVAVRFERFDSWADQARLKRFIRAAAVRRLAA